MALPTDTDYQEAIQNPRQVFLDPELQGGKVELMSSALPLPKARSGNFAVAFRMDCDHGSYAVKCFTRMPHPDLRIRYEEISKHLLAKRLPYTVGFRFIQNGIRARSAWFPILKMEWIHGASLGDYIGQNLRNPGLLIDLATKWIEMVRALQQADIAHGDLQHGNVLVLAGNLRLIDYDGMYVPGLAGRLSHEKGHQNYQHPQRETEFGPSLDNFSAWVIFVSILALAYEPRLWSQFKGGDECLLFRKHDFTEPDKSDLIQALVHSREQRIQSLASLLRKVIDLPPQQVPSLDGKFLPSGPVGPVSQPVPSWVAAHLRAKSLAQPASPNSASPLSDLHSEASWIFDFVEAQPATLAHFNNRPKVERIVMVLSVVFASMLGFGVYAGYFAPLALLTVAMITLVNAVVWLFRYRGEVVVKDRSDCAQKLAAVDREIAQLDSHVRMIQRDRRRTEAETVTTHSRLSQAHAAIEERELKEMQKPRHRQQLEMNAIAKLRAKLDEQENEALRVIQNGSGAELASVTQRLLALGQAESTDIAQALASLQQQHIGAVLQRSTIDAADIPGINRGLKFKLRDNGFHTAADIDQYRVRVVRGIGPKKASQLAYWRVQVESMARATMPTALPPAIAVGIQSRYRSHRTSLETERDRTQQLHTSEISSVRTRFNTLREPSTTQEAAVNDELRQAEAAIQARHVVEYSRNAANVAKAAADAKVLADRLENQIQEARTTSFALLWKRARLRHQLASFDAVRFRRYVRRIVPGLG